MTLLEGVKGAPLATLTAKLGGTVPPGAPAGQGSNVRPKARKRSRASGDLGDGKVHCAPRSRTSNAHRAGTANLQPSIEPITVVCKGRASGIGMHCCEMV